MAGNTDTQGIDELWTLLTQQRELLEAQAEEVAELKRQREQQSANLQRLERELEQQRLEKLALTDRVVEMEGGRTTGERLLSRAGLLKAAVAGVAGAAGATLLGATESQKALANGGGIAPDWVRATGPAATSGANAGVGIDATATTVSIGKIGGGPVFTTGVSAVGSSVGVQASSPIGSALAAQSSGATALTADINNFNGGPALNAHSNVPNQANPKHAIHGGSYSGPGVEGHSATNAGVFGWNHGFSFGGGFPAAVLGKSFKAADGYVHDETPAATADGYGIGVQGESGSGTGVFGRSTSGYGVYANSGSTAVYAESGDLGIEGKGRNSGVVGTGFVGVRGVGSGDGSVGLHGEGDGAQLYLVPAGSAGPPRTTLYRPGAIWMDQKATMWVCTAGGLSNPDTWVPVQQGGLNNALFTAVSTQQYHLPNSDGTTWWDIDKNNLVLTITPTFDCHAVLSAGADLWTFAPGGYAQDLGIFITGGTYGNGQQGQIVAWKRSGVTAPNSPNAVSVEAVAYLVAGTSYTIKLRWKANKKAIGATLYAGAPGPNGKISPTRLTALLILS